ncbi:MAG: class I SAM-dependent methyltransferase [Alphaproteobacteria bacterium]|jgi:predicted methyltransferase
MGFRAVTLAISIAAVCAAPACPASPHTGANTARGADMALNAAVGSAVRSPQNVARDVYRHPKESLLFWGLKPRMAILEIWPGAGYWTEILAPYAKATNGSYLTALSSASQRLPAKFSQTSVYGPIATSVFDENSPPLVKSGSVSFVLLSRNLHDWMSTPGEPEKAMRDFYAALKPGGILAIEQHRSDPRAMKPGASDGYMSTAVVVKLAEGAGFKLAATSEINANPKDTKDHPFGVWTLPPTRRSAPNGQPSNPNFEHAKYDAIGESDRMTLKFIKPA